MQKTTCGFTSDMDSTQRWRGVVKVFEKDGEKRVVVKDEYPCTAAQNIDDFNTCLSKTLGNGVKADKIVYIIHSEKGFGDWFYAKSIDGDVRPCSKAAIIADLGCTADDLEDFPQSS